MQIEYEATFPNINKESLRLKLQQIGAQLIRSEYIQKRKVYHLPVGHEISGGWLRVRDEGDRVTLSLKAVEGNNIEDQKEICITVDSFEGGCNLLKRLGCKEKAFQVSKRELWLLNEVEITLDEWPYLEPFVEIEGKSEEAVRSIAEQLEFDYAQALFGAVDTLYAQKYGISKERINNETPIIDFNQPNPFT